MYGWIHMCEEIRRPHGICHSSGAIYLFYQTESLTSLQLSKQVSLGTLQFRPPRTDIMSFLIPFLRTKHRFSRYVTSTYPLSYLLNPAM